MVDLAALLPVAARVGAATAQLAALLAVAPLLQGIIKKVKARCQNRRGPHLLQPYFDLAKYLAKASVLSEHASWVSRLTPYVVLGTICSAALLLPIVAGAPLAPFDDLILLLALFALARAWTVLAGLDAGSAFGGMGASRDVMVAALAEPGLLLVLLTVALRAGTLSLSGIAQYTAQAGFGGVSAASLLGAFALGLLVLAEVGRLPVDNPDTHLELTMIHEGMLLEASGRSLALLLWAQMLKQLAIVSLLVAVFFPWTGTTATGLWGLAVEGAVYVAKVSVIGVALGAVEMLEPKLRLFHLPRYLGAAYLVALLALVADVVVR